MPSPTWPTSGASRLAAAISRLAAVMHSASREIGTQTSLDDALGARPQRQRGVERVVARLPEPVAILGPGRPLEIGAAMLARDRLDGLRLLGDAGLRAVELEEQGRRAPVPSSFEKRMQASIGTSSSSSIRATGTPDWMVGSPC